MYAALAETQQHSERQRQKRGLRCGRILRLRLQSLLLPAHFTDQDCVSYVYRRTLARITQNKHQFKNKQDPKNNGKAGGRSLPRKVPFAMYVLYSLRGWVEGTYGDFFPAINPTPGKKS